MSTEVSPSTSKFHVNILEVVSNITASGTVREQLAMNYGSHQLDNANAGLSLLAEAQGDLSTDNDGFSVGGKIALTVGVAVGIALAGLALSCLMGPEMEIAADALDAVIVEGVADNVAADLVEETAGKAAKKAVASGIEGTSKMAGDDLVVSTKSVRGDNGAITNTISIKNTNNKGYSRVVTEEITDTGVSTTEKYTKKTYTPSFSASGKMLMVSAVIAGEGGVMGLNSVKASNETSEFQQQNSQINNASTAVNNKIQQTNAAISQMTQTIQGLQSLFNTALQAAQKLSPQ